MIHFNLYQRAFIHNLPARQARYHHPNGRKIKSLNTFGFGKVHPVNGFHRNIKSGHWADRQHFTEREMTLFYHFRCMTELSSADIL